MSLTDLKSNTPTPPRRRVVYYPERDGKPMAETPEHRGGMNYAIESADIILSNLPDVWVSGNDFIYYEEGNPRKRVSPDTYVVLGVPRKPRPNFKIWEEGRSPNLTFEFTSRDTAREDRESKFDLYQNVLKVPEYILFDPLNQYLRPRLQGYRLVNGVYHPIPFTPEGHLISQQTGIRMYADGFLLRFINPHTGETILTRAEAEAARIAESERATLESRRAEAEAQRAEAEVRRADAAEAEIERLRALVASLQPQRQERQESDG